MAGKSLAYPDGLASQSFLLLAITDLSEIRNSLEMDPSLQA
jgi:hypothetical protein